MIVKIEELWIGEWVQLKDSGDQGKYEGVSEKGELVVNLGEKSILTTIDNIRIVEPPKFQTNSKRKLPRLGENTENIFNTSIDLHIEVLAHGKQLSVPSRILQYQIQSCRDFMDQAIQKKFKILNIVHGKGQGVLKSEVLHLLKSYDDKIKFIIPVNSGGALEVWLKD